MEEQKSVLKQLEDEKWIAYGENIKERAESINTNNFTFLNDIDKEIRMKLKED